MPILDLQQRARELGRIRIGQYVKPANGKGHPEKLDRFRLTSASRPLLEQVAALYGGEVQEWTPQNGGAQAWEVITSSTRIPVLVPPQPVSQWYESWARGGCERRCDGVREVLTDAPCICGPDPEERVCKPTTRLNVVLAEVEGVGVFRLETHGYYAAVELPSAAELLASANGYIRGHLALEERVVKRDGKTKRFMVPTLEVGVTPAELLAGRGRVEAPAIEAPKPAALPAAPSAPALDVDNVKTALKAARSLDELRALWPEAKAAGLEQLARDLASLFPPPPSQPDAGTPDDVWAEILRTVPESWTTPQVEDDFARVIKVSAEKASAGEMRRYLAHLAGNGVQA